MGSTPATARAEADLAPLREGLDSVAGRGMVLFAGKGGVGKTTLASLAALHLSRSRRVVLFSTDPASNLSDLFPSASRDFAIEELDASALWARFLERNLAAFLELGDRGTYLERDELRRFFELSLPGVDELM
ncbi:MAG TPA: ArsA-related P-loop ATPase, partial [Thermoanaerobaculia bacterium]|nr:ArsA-related P-loop ATPase [Thermoanaerobaculia bacterium]